MLLKKLLPLILGIVIGFSSSMVITASSESTKTTPKNNSSAKPVPTEEYLKDNAPLSDNPYTGDQGLREELVTRLKNYQEIRNFTASDYSGGQTKGDIIPDKKHLMVIIYNSASGGLVGIVR